MNTTIGVKPAPYEQPIIEYLFGIIDSKLQYIDYQLNSEINTSFNIAGYNPDSASTTDLDKILPCKYQNKIVFDKIVQFSKTKRLLLLIRSMLENHNSGIVLELLTDNLFMYYSEKLLIKKLQSSLTNSTEQH